LKNASGGAGCPQGPGVRGVLFSGIFLKNHSMLVLESIVLLNENHIKIYLILNFNSFLFVLNVVFLGEKSHSTVPHNFVGQSFKPGVCKANILTFFHDVVNSIGCYPRH